MDFDGHAVSVVRQRCVDQLGPDADGLYEFYYEYDLFEFSFGDAKLTGRAYVDDAEEAHLLRIEVAGERKPLSARHLRDMLPRAAVHYLRSIGKTDLTWLDPDNDSSGYSPIP